MDYIRGIKAGFVAYAINLVATSMLQNMLFPILGKIVGDENTNPSFASAQMYASYFLQGILLLIAAASVFYAAKWFFKKNTPSVANGAILGGITVALNLVLMIVQDLPREIVGGTVGTMFSGLATLFTDYGFLLSIVVAVGAATYAGYAAQKKAAVATV